MWQEESQENKILEELFQSVRTIAVVGIKSVRNEDAYQIPLYMQAQGYRIVPVNPKLDSVLGETAYPSLGALPEDAPPIDLVNLFRAASHIAGHVDEILSLRPRPRAAWMQLGISGGPSAAKLRAEGMIVIEDRCIMVDHRAWVETP